LKKSKKNLKTKNIFSFTTFFYHLLLTCIILSFNCAGNKLSIKDLISEQQSKYNLITVQDIFKLFYQSVFGVKHLLKDPIASKKYLYEEYSQIDTKDEPLFENISLDGNIVRVNLKSFKFRKLSIEKLFEVMTISADQITGDLTILKKYWEEFEDLVKKGYFNFDLGEIKKYNDKLQKIPKEIYHSQIYIKKYDPSYRVVRKDIFLKFFPEIKDQY